MCLRLDYILQQLMLLFNHIILSRDNLHTLVLANFQRSQYDPSLFLRKTSHGITILLVYIDDIIITGDDPHNILQLQKSLHASYEGFRSFENFLRHEFHRIL